jgi:hypothetical protein
LASYGAPLMRSIGPLEMNLVILPDKALLAGHDLLKLRESAHAEL